MDTILTNDSLRQLTPEEKMRYENLFSIIVFSIFLVV